MGAPVSRAPPFYPRVSTAPSFFGARRRSRGARTSRASRRLGGRGRRTGAAAPGPSHGGISAAERLGQVRSGGGRALVSSWGDLLRAGGCRPQGTGALAAGGSCPVLSSPPLRCEPSCAWGHQLQPPRGKGASPCIKLGSSPFFPQRREEKAAPLGVSGSRGFLQRRKTPGPRPPCPSWPLQRSAPAGSCF